MERGVHVAVRLVAGVFFLLTLWVGFWMVIAGPGLRLHARNPRLAQAERMILRGGIYFSGGQPLALTRSRDGARIYAGPTSASHWAGYVDPTFGKAGLESTFDKELLGLHENVGLARFWAGLLGARQQGWDLVTTVDLELQEIAAHALEHRTGAIVAIDPHTGAIRAMVSSPGYRPEQLAQALDGSMPGAPLFNRATMGQYPPGSAIKPLVLAAALETRVVDPGSVFMDDGAITVDGRTIANDGGVAFGTIAVDDALALSSNAVFAQLAADVGGQRFREIARAMGFGLPSSVELPQAKGFVPDQSRLSDPAAMLEIGIGQGELLVTPLQMAVMASAFANGGWRVHPHIGERLRSPRGDEMIIPQREPVRVLSPGAAHVVKEAMVAVVRRGTGQGAAVAGLDVAGKTGSAENPHGRPHAWFIGFAPADDPRLAVAIVVENGGFGGQVAAPIARRLFSAWIKSETG